MNKAIIIGNLTHTPELRATQDGTPVCNFTVAVNRRVRGDQQSTDYFRVTAWRTLGENCAKYLAKGRKVGVTGTISARAYNGNDGQVHATLELTAEEVEFLTPKSEQPAGGGCAQMDDTGLPNDFR